jgi:cation transport ATPase
MAKKRKKSKSAQKTAASATEESKAKDEKKITVPKKDAKERKKARADGIVMTLYPAVLGVIFGFVSLQLFGTGVPEEGSMGMTYPWYFVMILVIATTFYVQKFTYPYLKIKVEEFKTKDWLYVEFIAVDLWLVSWTLLLN